LKARTGVVFALALPAVLSACGGTRQDAGEPSGTFPVTIVQHTFPSSQPLAGHAILTIAVRNTGSRTVPDVAVTIGGPGGVNGFTYNARPSASVCASASPPTSCQLADSSRPVWIVNRGPGAQPGQTVEGNYSNGGGVTAYTNTWALGSLAPLATATFTWDVTAVVAGRHTIAYRVAAGLNGKAIAQDPQGGVPQGTFTVNVPRLAPQSRVDPNTGRVIRSPPAVAGGSHGNRGAGSSGSGGSNGSGGSGGSAGSSGSGGSGGSAGTPSY
jgi:uncharacterized membrane protein YgcG